jgi:organic hydroperoxide reductase OsmC/OhrA
MAGKVHHYRVRLDWTGGADADAASFRRHDRGYVLSAAGKPAIAGSSDAVFRGDAARWNPEDLLVASLSACHQLWYMGLCAASGVVVAAYADEAEGVMTEEEAGGAGQFTEVVLRPRVTLAKGADRARAEALHALAHAKCFIARSVNFPVTVDAVVTEHRADGR